MQRPGITLGAALMTLMLIGCGSEAPAENPNSEVEAAQPFEGDEPGECSDGADNDQDKAYDCDDSDCAGAPNCKALERREEESTAPDALADVSITEDTQSAPEEVTEPSEEDTEAPEPDGLEELDADAGPAPEPEPEPEIVDPANPCPPLGDPTGTLVEVTPQDLDTLGLQLASAAEGTTFLLADGTYALGDEPWWIPVKGTTLRSKSGNADQVILDGGFSAATGLIIAASQVTIAALTIRSVTEVAVDIRPDPGQSTLSGVRLEDVHIVDALERAVRVAAYNDAYVDHGVVACSEIHLSEAGREALDGACDVGGIDLSQAMGWTLRDTLVSGLWCPGGEAKPAMLAWRSSADTLVARNRIEDCTRGIGLGEGQSPFAGDRTYEDITCDTEAHVDHYRGVVRNNMLFVGGEAFMEANAKYESGIHLWSNCQGTAIHNSVVGLKKPYSSIEWHREGTVGAQILNNLVSHNLRERTGATAFQLGNLEEADETLFVDHEGGDLHLAPNVLGAIDAGEDVPVGLADHDFDGDQRLGTRDIGADEFTD